jgi:predicted DNA-binding protein
MKHINRKKDIYLKSFSIRMSQDDIEKLKKIIGPYGKVTAFIRAIIKQHIDKAENKAAA